MQKIDAWLKLACTAGVTVPTRNRLLDLAENDPVRALLDEGLAVSESLDKWRRAARSNDVSAELCWLDGQDCHLIVRKSDSYPPLLKHIPDPPVALFVRGQLESLTMPAVAVVGSRRATRQGRERASAFSQQLSGAGYCVVSGLAHGIDASSHAGALEWGERSQSASTVAIMATGPDVIYPSRNRELARRIAQCGALVTEYRCTTAPMGYHFPHRNRIVSGLAAVTVVIEADNRSGSLITAGLAAAQGRDVYAVPGVPQSPTSRGCHELIRSGAGLVESPEQLLMDLGVVQMNACVQPSKNAKVSSEQRILAKITHGETVYDCVGFEPTELDFIVLQSRLTIDRVCSILSRIEIAGLIRAVDGGRYIRLAPSQTENPNRN